MKPPLRRLTKEQIIWLGEHYCQHGMPYLEHYNCFLHERPASPMKERIGYLDIETSGFYADYDFMLSWCILEEPEDQSQEPKLYKDLITTKEITKAYSFDKRLCSSMVSAMRGFDRLVVYYGTDNRFDIPFSRTRALKWGIDFPKYRELFVEDAYGMVRQKLRLSRNRLGNICGLLEIPAKTLPGDPNIWMRATAGSQKDLEYVLEHNIEDVESLRALYHRIKDFGLRGKRSL